MKSFVKPRARKNTESWQVVYIDLMTNVMVFFVILWSINQGKSSKITPKVGDETSRTVSLPGDIIFSPGKTVLTENGKTVFKNLFSDAVTGQTLNFETSGLSKRLLVIHGHTDSDGKKDENFELGFYRAIAAFHEIQLYSKEIPEHVILCSHADNSPAQELPFNGGNLTPEQLAALHAIKAKNRRITIEDKIESRVQQE